MKKSTQTRAPRPDYTLGEYRADALIHLCGVACGWGGGLWLLASRPATVSGGILAALTVYMLGMTAMLCASAAYNLVLRQPLKEQLRRFDHACIYAAIAGTYTPLLLRLPDPLVMPGLLLVWGIAVAGMALKLLRPRRHERIGLVLYLGLGWICLPMIPALDGRLAPGTALWIGLGGLTYTLGVGFYLAERLRYHNAVWHLMVLLAAACHLRAMTLEFPT